MSHSARLARPYRQVARAQAAMALRDRILQAFVDALLVRWLDEITLEDIATAAGTTRQTINRLFGEKPELFAEAVKVLSAQIEAAWRMERGASAHAIAAVTVVHMDRHGRMLMRLLALAHRHPECEPCIKHGRANHRLWMHEMLAPQLAAMDPATAERALCECLIATDTYTWALLRLEMGYGAEQTQAIIADMLRKAAGEF